MAIYHFSAKIISRGKGQSAVASASYRSGEKLEDEQTGEIKYYKRDVQPDTMILAPDHAPEWVHDRQRLWNEVEKVEKHSRSQLSREFEVALPVELSNDQQKELIQNYAQEQFVDRGMVADISIHRDDKNNPHAHIMCTMRSFDENGEWENKKYKEYLLDKNNEKILDKKGKPKYKTHSVTDWDKRENIKIWREAWSKHANKIMERENIDERIDHRSHEDRNLETLPTIHLGHRAHAMEKRNEETERGNHNRDVEEYNGMVVELNKYRKEKKELQKQIETKKYLEPSELADVKSATKVINDKGKGFVSLESIGKRVSELFSREKDLVNKTSVLNNKQIDFERAQNKVDKLVEINQRKESLLNEISKIKDIRGVWEDNKWEGTKKAFERIFNRKLGNEQIEKAQETISYLERHESIINNELEPYRNKLGFSSNDQFYKKQIEFDENRNREMATIETKNDEIKEHRSILSKARQALDRKDVREILSNYPELSHLSETMKHKDALNIKKINETVGQTVSIDSIKQELKSRIDTIDKSEKRLQTISRSEKHIERAESNFDKLEEVQSKIDNIDNNPFLKGKRMFSKNSKQDYEGLIAQRDHLQNAINKDFSSKEDLNNYKKIVERVAQKERPQLIKDIQQAKEGKLGVSVEHLQQTINSIERAEREHQRGSKQRENEKVREHERELGG